MRRFVCRAGGAWWNGRCVHRSNARQVPWSGQSIQIKFRPAQTAIFAETNVSESELSRICSDAENQGRADFTLNSTLSDGNGNIFATGHGIYVIKLAQVPEELRY